MDVDEQELVERFQQGDEAAFAELFDNYKAKLRNYIYGIKEMAYQYDRDDLTDIILNDAFLKAWKKRATYDKVKSKFTTWIHQIAINLFRDECRRRRKYRALMQDSNIRMDKYSDYARSSFCKHDEKEIKYVPKTRKERRERLDCSDLDKSTKRLFVRIVAYRWNFDGVNLSPRERKIIALADKFTSKKEIARKLRMSIPVCNTAISRIIKKLPVDM